MKVKNDFCFLEIKPDDMDIKNKISLMIELIKNLVDVFMQKQLYGIILSDEYPAFFQFMLFKKCESIFLKPP